MGQVSQYWIGLSVEPLAAEQRKNSHCLPIKVWSCMPFRPKARPPRPASRPSDVILTAGDRALKSVPDLVQAIDRPRTKTSA